MKEKELLINGNKSFVLNSKADKETDEALKELVKGQNPSVLIITCSDSRVSPEEIFSLGLGWLFVIRTAGNVINEGELASVEYGIEHLHIKYVLVLGHTHCGAVHAALHNEKGKYLDPILNQIKKNIIDEKDELEASKKNALEEVKFLKEKFPEYDGIFEAGLYDIETRKVCFIK
ncbi:MAG: carbonic anhydrase [Bacilli bacterium]|nr:carbonic anhydrase [Bacilli bacterium]